MNDSPVDCQSRRRPRRAVRAATEPHPSRQIAQLSSRLEQSDKKLNTCGFSSFGRAPPCQGGGGGFEPRNPLHEKRHSHRVSFCFYLYPGLCSRQELSEFCGFFPVRSCVAAYRLRLLGSAVSHSAHFASRKQLSTVFR